MEELKNVSLVNMAHHSKKLEECIVCSHNTMIEDIAYYIEKNKRYYDFVLNNKMQLDIFIKYNNLDKSYFFIHRNLSNIIDCFDKSIDIQNDKYDTSLPSVTLKIKTMIDNIDETYTVKNNSNHFINHLNYIIKMMRIDKNK